MKSISIILPVYNVEDYILKNINSIIIQSFQDFELIIIDDCGSDNSIQLCKQILSGSIINYKIIHNGTNKGISESRNIGISHSTAEYILCIDSDDWIDSYMLERLYLAAVKYNADLVSCSATKYWEANDVFTKVACLKMGVYTPEVYLNHLFNGEASLEIWGKLIRRNLFKTIKFPEKMTFEDVLTVPYIINKASKIVQLEDPLYFYVKRSSNTSLSGSEPPNVNVFLYQLKKLKNTFELNSSPNSIYSQKYIYKNLLVYIYSSIYFSENYTDIKLQLRLISSFIIFKDIFTLRKVMLAKHVSYLLFLKTSSYLFYLSFKSVALIKQRYLSK